MNEPIHIESEAKAETIASAESRLSVEQTPTFSIGRSYSNFLASKSIVAKPAGIETPENINENLFPFQIASVRSALQRGRSALFLGTGLGKTACQAEWAKHVEAYTEKPSLILAPLAVSHQTIEEAKKILGLEITFAEHGSAVGDRGIYITNYQKLERFNSSVFGSVVWDESSILKSVDGKTRQRIMDAFGQTPFRLACTATPAPNDYMELGNHAEALGIMKASEMLATFFVHDGAETQKWRLKKHAEKDFWRWMASWCICAQKPSDIGFDDAGYILPELRMHEHIVDCDSKPLPGELFALPARTLKEQQGARRGTISERADALAEIIGSDVDQWLVWCKLNDEADAIKKKAGMVNVQGSDSDDVKEKRLLEFASGELKRLVSKASICGYGMNLQKCHNMAFLGMDHSWEQFYQAIRRCWRYGQQNPVDVHIVISSLEIDVLRNNKRKEADAQRMQSALIEHMADLTKESFGKTHRNTTDYEPKKEMEIPAWIN